MLIREGYTFAGDCSDGGLDTKGAMANECGLEAARPLLENQQNSFDEAIYQAGRTYHLPPRILKGIFSRESQFFRGTQKPNLGWDILRIMGLIPC